MMCSSTASTSTEPVVTIGANVMEDGISFPRLFHFPVATSTTSSSVVNPSSSMQDKDSMLPRSRSKWRPAIRSLDFICLLHELRNMNRRSRGQLYLLLTHTFGAPCLILDVFDSNAVCHGGFVDMNWNAKVGQIVRHYLEVERLLWRLSTLGGACSAMGEYDAKFVEDAAMLSVAQYRIASEYGNPLLVARCHLFFALALIQKGQLDVAARIIRRIHRYAKSIDSHFLCDCCLGVWARLRLAHVRNKNVTTSACSTDERFKHNNSDCSKERYY